jgi:hypothetical protein
MLNTESMFDRSATDVERVFALGRRCLDARDRRRGGLAREREALS